jgi:hypothetical protein
MAIDYFQIGMGFVVIFWMHHGKDSVKQSPLSDQTQSIGSDFSLTIATTLTTTATFTTT